MQDMINFSDLSKIDSEKMFQVYDKWPEIARESYENNLNQIDIKNIDHIVFAGMGGSGSIGDIFSAILSKTNLHISVVKGYLLPKTVDKNTLVITTSVSGKTVETLTVLNQAKQLDCKVSAFSSGEKIEDYCLKNGIDYWKIPEIHSPRASLPSFLYSMLKILQPIIPIAKTDVTESFTELSRTKMNISSSNFNESNISLDLAQWIKDIPLMYYPVGLQAAAIRFKSSIQENAKSHIIIEDVIESCHNGIVAWERKFNINPILLQGTDDHPKTKERWAILKEYFTSNGIEYKEIFSLEGNILTKLINLIYQLDYTSIYYAVISNVDPSPVKSIDFIKNKLEETNQKY